MDAGGRPLWVRWVLYAAACSLGSAVIVWATATGRSSAAVLPGGLAWGLVQLLALEVAGVRRPWWALATFLGTTVAYPIVWLAPASLGTGCLLALGAVIVAMAQGTQVARHRIAYVVVAAVGLWLGGSAPQAIPPHMHRAIELTSGGLLGLFVAIATAPWLIRGEPRDLDGLPESPGAAPLGRPAVLTLLSPAVVAAIWFAALGWEGERRERKLLGEWPELAAQIRIRESLTGGEGRVHGPATTALEQALKDVRDPTVLEDDLQSEAQGCSSSEPPPLTPEIESFLRGNWGAIVAAATEVASRPADEVDLWIHLFPIDDGRFFEIATHASSYLGAPGDAEVLLRCLARLDPWRDVGAATNARVIRKLGWSSIPDGTLGAAPLAGWRRQVLESTAFFVRAHERPWTHGTEPDLFEQIELPLWRIGALVEAAGVRDRVARIEEMDPCTIDPAVLDTAAMELLPFGTRRNLGVPLARDRVFAARYALQQELTRHVVAARAERAMSGSWPPAARVPSEVCASRAWVRSPRPDDTIHWFLDAPLAGWRDPIEHLECAPRR